MQQARIRGLAGAFLLALCQWPVAASAADTGSLVGTWQVETIADTDAAGAVTYPYGEHPRGYMVYDPTGRMHAQVMRMPATRPFASGDDARGTDAEVRAAYAGYVAYFGTYHVDERRSTVVHRVEGSLMPGYTGTDQPRPFKLDGDVLTIEGDSDGIHFLRRFRRVK